MMTFLRKINSTKVLIFLCVSLFLGLVVTVSAFEKKERQSRSTSSFGSQKEAKKNL
uniref:hypothetical protein n=1 Tax=Streptococcus uberis TaxID=1349 RepID=UPI003CCFEE17